MGMFDRFKGPVRRGRDGFVLALDEAEVEVLGRLLGELEELLTDDSPEAAALALRLFPPAHPDDPEAEAEYQRWMRSELIESRLASIAAVRGALAADGPLDESQLSAFARSLNSLRLVLGVMLDVNDDPDRPEMRPGLERSAEANLYGYLSWLLEWTIQALSGDVGTSPGP